MPGIGLVVAVYYTSQQRPNQLPAPPVEVYTTVLENGVEAWATSASKCVQEDVSNSAAYLHGHFRGRKFAKKVVNQFESEYDPLMDLSAELGPISLNCYWTQIGVLRWMVELGRIDIITEVSMLASQLALPREGHLEAVFHIFGYLKGHHNSRMVFGPTCPTPDMSMFQEHDWCSFYGDMKEAIPPNAPEPRGKEVGLRIFVDSDHAGDKLARQSRTGYIIFLNNAPIAWLSQKQSTIETSVFGADFFVMKIGMGKLQGL